MLYARLEDGLSGAETQNFVFQISVEDNDCKFMWNLFKLVHVSLSSYSTVQYISLELQLIPVPTLCSGKVIKK